MDTQSNPPLITDEDYLPTQGALPVWIKVFTKPGEQTFLDIIGHPDAKAKSAYLWVFLAGMLSGLVSGLTQTVGTLIGLRQLAPDVGQIPGFSGMFGAAGLVGALCAAPLAGLFSLIGFIFFAAIIHGSAKFLGGQGNFDQMAYSFGAIAAPLTLISALIVPFNLIPYVALCTLPLIFLLSLYALYLDVAAIKAVHKFGWGGSAAALFLPTILFGLLCALLSMVLLRMADPSFNEIFQQLQQIQPGMQ